MAGLRAQHFGSTADEISSELMDLTDMTSFDADTIDFWVQLLKYVGTGELRTWLLPFHMLV